MKIKLEPWAFEPIRAHKTDAGLDLRTPIDFSIAGEKIAQLVICPCLIEETEIVEELTETERGKGGFGSTGK